MSFPSVSRILATHKINAATADEHTLVHALLNAVRLDLGEGFSELQRAAEEFRASEKERVLHDIPRDSLLGKHICRLVGTDAARPSCEHVFGVSLALYYPCVVVLAKQPDDLRISAREQARILEKHDLVPTPMSSLTTDSDVQAALARWFEDQNPRGMAHLRRLAHDACEQRIRVRRDLDPKSTDGLEVANVMGTHMARQIFSDRFGVHLGFLNCCGPAAQDKRTAPVGDETKPKTPQKRGDRTRGTDDAAFVLTLREQIAMQATADC